jgi:hypothetical protein
MKREDMYSNNLKTLKKINSVSLNNAVLVQSNVKKDSKPLLDSYPQPPVQQSTCLPTELFCLDHFANKYTYN